MQILLQGKGTWGIVTGKEVAPSTDTQNDRYKNWKKKRDVPLTDIFLSIEYKFGHAVINFDGPKTACDKLQ